MTGIVTVGSASCTIPIHPGCQSLSQPSSVRVYSTLNLQQHQGKKKNTERDLRQVTQRKKTPSRCCSKVCHSRRDAGSYEQIDLVRIEGVAHNCCCEVRASTAKRHELAVDIPAKIARDHRNLPRVQQRAQVDVDFCLGLRQQWLSIRRLVGRYQNLRSRAIEKAMVSGRKWRGRPPAIMNQRLSW